MPVDCPVTVYEVRGASLFESAPAGAEIRATPAACKPIAHGSLVLFRTSANRRAPVIKRAIGLPGGRFALRGGGRIFINGAEAKTPRGESYNLSGKRLKLLRLYETNHKGVIPPGLYLLMGDAPSGGLDSSQIGLVPEADIIGVVDSVTAPPGTEKGAD